MITSIVHVESNQTPGKDRGYEFRTLFVNKYIFYFSEKHEANLRPALHKVRIHTVRISENSEGTSLVCYILNYILGSSDKVQCEPKICDNSSDSKRDTNGGRKTWNSPAGRIRDLDFKDSSTYS